MTATLHRNADSRAGPWQTLSQLLPATGHDALRSNMHTPAASRCIFHRTGGRRVARINQDQSSPARKHFASNSCRYFRVKQPQEHALSLLAELRHRLHLGSEVEVFGVDGFVRFSSPLDRRSQGVGEYRNALPRTGVFSRSGGNRLKRSMIAKRVGLPSPRGGRC